MKKIVVLLVFTLLIGCSQTPKKDSKLKIDETKTSYEYTVEGVEESFTLHIPTILFEETKKAEIVYSLNPLQENVDELELLQSPFFKEDVVDTNLKDQLYQYAYYGYGFWELNPTGLTNLAENKTLVAEDYSINHGDFYNSTSTNNEEKIAYYLAAQELIWESLVNPETKKNYSVTFTTMDTEIQKDDILKTMLEMKRLPFSAGNVINLKQEDINNQTTFTLEDNEKVMKRFEMLVPEGIEIIDSKENTLSFVVKEYKEGLRIDFDRRFAMKQALSYLFTSDKNISYLSIGDDRYKVVQSIHIEKHDLESKISLNINTLDEETKEELVNAQYELSTGPEFLAPVQSTIAETDKPARFENLVPGQYWLQQINAPEGYVLNSEVMEITIEEGIKLKELPFMNKKDTTNH